MCGYYIKNRECKQKLKRLKVILIYTIILETHLNMSAKINIIKLNEFNSANLVSSSPKPLGNKGGKSVSVNYRFPEGQSMLTIQTPWMRSYGIGKWVDEDAPEAPPKLSITLAFNGMDADPKMKELHDFLEQLDNWAVDAMFRNSWEWLKVKNAPKETIAFNYNPSFKTPKDKTTGEPTGKPDYMKLKIALGENGYNVSFFDKERKLIPTDEVESTFSMGSRVKGLIQCTGFWIVNGKFGLSWKLKQLIIDPPSRIGKEYAFNDEEEEEETTVSASASTSVETPKKTVVPSQPKAEELLDSDDDKKDEDTSQQVKKVVRKVISKK